jgi:Aldehyde dehydrogenase family
MTVLEDPVGAVVWVGQRARVRAGGNPALPDSGGPYLEPTVVSHADRDNILVREELFGPVLVVQTFTDDREALEMAVSLNDHDGWYLGVQWHPEDTAHRDPQQARILRPSSPRRARDGARLRPCVRPARALRSWSRSCAGWSSCRASACSTVRRQQRPRSR